MLGHPRADSLSHALGRAYKEGAQATGASVHVLSLSDLHFELNVDVPSPRNQHVEEDMLRARELIAWADHLVFVYPTWWGTTPALLKGFLDRVLTSGFAFNEVEGGTGYEGLLQDKSAQLITTMDTPRWVYRWIYRMPGHNAMKRATLQFCGIWPVRISAFGPVRKSTPSEREAWLEEVRREGRKLEGGVLTRWDIFRQKGKAWLKAIRLQFYPMAWLAYTAGALGAAARTDAFSSTAYWLGYLYLFFLEAATVLTNEYFDYESDRENEYYSMFSGGSRVLVEGILGQREVLLGAVLALALAASAAGALFGLTAVPLASALVLVLCLSVLALGYTVPPLKLSHRGLGEIDVALTHSLGVILCGYVFQGGQWHDPLPWILSIPLFLAVLPAILLAGIPDYEADRAADKETLVVKIGPPRAVALAMAATALAALTSAGWYLGGVAEVAYGAALLLVLPHSLLLLVMLYRYWTRQRARPQRIDRLIGVALAYIIWFGAIPLVALL